MEQTRRKSMNKKSTYLKKILTFLKTSCKGLFLNTTVFRKINKFSIFVRQIFLLGAGVLVFVSSQAAARNYVHIVGSSTVFPFAAVVAEQFGKRTAFKTPVVESNGSGGGLKLFCSGVGKGYPDIANTSRSIKKSEYDRCAKIGIKISELKIGYDGIVLANAKEAPLLYLSRKDIFLAIAKLAPEGNQEGGQFILNPNKTWKDVNPSLPDIAIKIYGPPPTSGTRDAFNELAMEEGCKFFEHIKALKKSDKSYYKTICHSIREDGFWVDSGESDNLLIRKLENNPSAFGVFGFSFLDQNWDKVQGSFVDGVEPAFENISSQTYPISRSLFFYVKKNHIGIIPGIHEYVRAFMSRNMIDYDSDLSFKGLIPLSEEEMKKNISAGKTLPDLIM